MRFYYKHHTHIYYLTTLFKFFFVFFSLITMQRRRVSFLGNFAFFPLLTVSCIVTSRYWREIAIAQFLLLSFFPFLCVSSFFSGCITYSCIASLQNIGSLTNIVSSFTNLEKSANMVPCHKPSLYSVHF